MPSLHDEGQIPHRGDYCPPAAASTRPPTWINQSLVRPPSLAVLVGLFSTPSTRLFNIRSPLGARPSQRHATIESQINSLRQIIRTLEGQTQDLRTHNRLLQGPLNQHIHKNPLPEVATWEVVQPPMKGISKRLMLGLDLVKTRMFPRDEHIKQGILDVSNVGEGDTITRSAF